MASTLPLPTLINAASWDAGNRSMEKAGRSKWSRADYNAAARKHNEIVDACFGTGAEGGIKFSIAAQLEEEGYVTIDMPSRNFFGVIDHLYNKACGA